MKLTRGQVELTLVCIILGLMLATQFRSAKESNPTLHFQRVEDLTRRLAQADQERMTLQSEVHSLRSGTASLDAQQDQAKAGLTDITGPGITVTMDDSAVRTASGKSADLYLIRDIDILQVLNELRAAGAEAIAINGQRVVATTAVRNAGPAIVVNNTAISAPIEIKAIGDPATLVSALKIRGGVIETRQIWGIQIAVVKQPSLEIPTYKGLRRFEYAKVMKENT